MAEAKVIFGDNEVYLYNEKAPYIQSGKSILGAVEYDEEEDKVKCHECGNWYKAIASHLRWCKSKKVANSFEYKKKHGLPMSAALVGERLRLVRAELASRPERLKNFMEYKKRTPKKWSQKTKELSAKSRNRYGVKVRELPDKYKKYKHVSVAYALNRHKICAAQIIERLQKLAGRLGRTPSRTEIHEEGINYRALRYYYGTPNEAFRLAALKPNPIQRINKYSDEALLEHLRSFHRVHGRVPTESDFRRKLIASAASKGTYANRFGRWNNALRRAGLVPRTSSKPKYHQRDSRHLTAVASGAPAKKTVSS